MNVTIKPSVLSGTVKAPPSKSYAHRLLICAALSDRECNVENVSCSDDIQATRDCIEALKSGGRIYNCRESGSTLRFFAPLSVVGGGEAVLCGSERLIGRGISEYEAVFSAMGIEIEKHPTDIALRGRLRAGEYTLRGDVSSQFVTGLLLALPLLDGDSRLTVLSPVESRSYIDVTLDVLKMFNISVFERERNVFEIPGAQKYRGTDSDVEGDWSNAAFFHALCAMGAEIKVTGLTTDSIQGDRRCLEYFRTLKDANAMIDISDTPDLAPLLMAFAAMNKGGRLTGTKRLRLKESDRAAVMAEELRKFGAKVIVNDNSVDIIKSRLYAPDKTLSAHNDHRIVMALTLPCLSLGGTISGAEAVKKSWPEFFEVLLSLGADVSLQ